MDSRKWKSNEHFVSHYNFLTNVVGKGTGKGKVEFHDVTLRDGEQQAGIVFRRETKLRIARKLDEAGVDRIEAGLPSVSSEDSRAIGEIAHLGLSAKVYAFSRCMKSDVDNALKLDVDGLVMEIPSSGHLIRYGYGWSVRRAIDLSVEATSYAHSHGLRVVFFTIDATRASFDEVWRLVGTVAREGHMDALALADTFGVMNPEATSFLIKKFATVTRKPIEIHAHNDFGLGVANTIAAVNAGARTVHVTVNGIGERSGNASLEEVAIALRLLYGMRMNLKFEELKGLSDLVEDLSGVELPPQKPVVGDGIFTIESGIIAGWWRRVEGSRPLETFPFLPELVGHSPVKVVLGKKSGKDSVLYKMEKMGIKADEEELQDLLLKTKEIATREKRNLTDAEIASLFHKRRQVDLGRPTPLPRQEPGSTV